MILEPWKSPEEINRRLRAINDPELAELLRSANREFLGGETESYASPCAPYWKKRVGLIALAGLLAMAAGYAGSISTSHEHARTKPVAAIAPARHRVGHAALPAARPAHHAVAAAHHRSIIAAAPAAIAPGPSEALIRQARAQLLHERAVAAEARAQTARAEHQARIALQAQAEARAQAQAEALAQARAEAVAQAHAEALAQAQAEGLARAQAESAAADRAQEQLLQNASDPGIKPGDGPPPATGRIGPAPSANVPLPAPGPVDPNCTPHRGAFLTTVLDHVRVGGTNAGALLRIIHP